MFTPTDCCVYWSYFHLISNLWLHLSLIFRFLCFTTTSSQFFAKKKKVFSFCRWRIYGEKCDRNASRNAVTGSSMSWRSPLASTVWTPSPQGQLPFLGEGYALKCHYNKFTNCSHSLRVLFKGFQAETFGAGGLCFCSEVFHLRFPMLLIPALFL